MQQGITVKTDRPSPEEIVEESRRLLNNRVEELHRNNGITMQSDLTIMDAVAAIRALTAPASKRKSLTDGEVIKAAGRWYNPSLLSKYLDSQSAEYQRDRFKIGVYTLFELKKSKLVPLLVESTPQYVGESADISNRLRQHASGHLGSNPADHVTQEYLRFHTNTDQQIAYVTTYTKQEQRVLRRKAMESRRLWVQTIHLDNKRSARRLEDAMSQWYRSQGYTLWNDLPRPRPYIA